MIRHLDVGLIAYSPCLELQHKVHAEVLSESRLGVIMTAEHEPVITLGKHADHTYLLSGRDWLAANGIDLVQTDRGGEVTAHEPGQLVVYPILRLADFHLSPRKYVALLEEAIIQLLIGYGISGHLDPEHPGVWVGTNKICAVGVRIKDRVSMHGIALNITNAMKIFQMIVPCGIVDRGVTSIERELSCSAPRLDEVRRQLVAILQQKLSLCLSKS